MALFCELNVAAPCAIKMGRLINLTISLSINCIIALGEKNKGEKLGNDDISERHCLKKT